MRSIFLLFQKDGIYLDKRVDSIFPSNWLQTASHIIWLLLNDYYPWRSFLGKSKTLARSELIRDKQTGPNNEVDKIWILSGFARIFILFIHAWNCCLHCLSYWRNRPICAWIAILWKRTWTLCQSLRRRPSHPINPLPHHVDHPQDQDKWARHHRHWKNWEILHLRVWFPGDHWNDCSDLIIYNWYTKRYWTLPYTIEHGLHLWFSNVCISTLPA